MTNAHVISPPRGAKVEKIDVVFANGDHVPGRVTAVDREADLALVKVDNYAKLPPALPVGDSRICAARTALPRFAGKVPFFKAGS